MTQHTIIGGGGARLHLVEAGDPRGPSILFLHGFSQCSLCWDRQLHSDLARHYRLVAMDLRGHGTSDRPRDGYDDSALWAADVAAAIDTLALDRPILCGWSYGPLVILDYLRHHGDEHVGGIHFVDGITKLGSEAALAVFTPELLALVPAFFSDDAAESVRGLQGLLGLCFAHAPETTDLYTMLGYNASVPPFVRRALFSRVIDNDDVLPTITAPVLVTHGTLDRVVKPDAVNAVRALLPNAEIDLMSDAGHSPFRDTAAAFNARLAAFRDSTARALAAR